MSKGEIVSAIINGCVALGTITVAILAIWGDQFRTKFFGPKLKLVAHNLNGIVVPLNNGKRGIFYHLKVVNEKNLICAKNCHVMLTKLWKKDVDGNFPEIELPVPLTFVWSPAEFSPPYINLLKDNVLDFGKVIEGEKIFLPILHSYTNNFKGFVHPDETLRFGLEIISENYVSPKPQIFEVYWNGQWNENIEIMKNNLHMQEILNP